MQLFGNLTGFKDKRHNRAVRASQTTPAAQASPPSANPVFPAAVTSPNHQAISLTDSRANPVAATPSFRQSTPAATLICYSEDAIHEAARAFQSYPVETKVDCRRPAARKDSPAT